jgi:ATP-dependent helicase/nuclease subunit A
MNARRFPPFDGGSPTIFYDDRAGLRQRICYATTHGEPYLYDVWQTVVIARDLGRDFDEKRRPLYVAITRAENHVIFTGGKESVS